MPRGGVRKKAGQSQGQKPAVAPYSPTVVNKVLKAPDFYVKNLQRLEVLLEQQKVALRKARQQQLWEQERQKILVEAIATQEELERILAQQQLLLAKHADTDPQLFPQISAASAASGQNWTNSCLAAATLQHIMQVKAMSVDDWLQRARAGFPQLAMLLELANRELEAKGARGYAADADNAAACNGNGHLGEAAAAAAGADNPEAATWHEAGPVAARIFSEAGQMLVKVVSEDVKTIYLTMYHNPQPYYHYAALNHATGALQMAPASLQQAVVQRLQLSPLQVLHMRIIASEFARLSRAASKEGDDLAEQVAKLSLAAVLDSSEVANGEVTEGPARGTSNGNDQPSDTSAVAAGTAAQQPSGNASSESPATNNAAAATAAASAAAGDAVVGVTAEADAAEPGDTQSEAMRKQLDRYLRHINIHTVVTAVCVTNTLTPRQLATMNVASYPYAPNVHAVAEACLSLDVEMPDKLPTKVAAAAGADDWEPSAEPAAAAPPDAPYVDALHRGWLAEVDEHMIRRSNILRQQLRRWWHKIGGAVSSGTDGDSTM